MEENLIKKYQPPKEIKSEHKELMIKIGLKLEELRKDKQISSSGLAKEIGISRNAYHQMEIGNVYFNLLSLLQVLNYHQVSLPDFFNTLK